MSFDGVFFKLMTGQSFVQDTCPQTSPCTETGQTHNILFVHRYTLLTHGLGSLIGCSLDNVSVYMYNPEIIFLCMVLFEGILRTEGIYPVRFGGKVSWTEFSLDITEKNAAQVNVDL